MEKLRAFIEGGHTDIERSSRRAAIKRSLKRAESGKLKMMRKPEQWHDVAPISSNPRLLELRWRHHTATPEGAKDHQVRLYFDEPSDQPTVMRGLNAHEKVSDDDQQEQIYLAERVRVEGTDFT